MSREGSSTLVAAFDDIDRLSTTVRSHTDFVRSCIGRVACVAADPDLAASFPLSPITGVQAEGAVALAVSRLVVHAATAEGMAIMAATVVTTYRLAEESLSLAATGLADAAGIVDAIAVSSANTAIASFVVGGSMAVLFGSALIGVKVAVDSMIAGFGDELVDSLASGLLTTLEEYLNRPERVLGGGALFATHFGANTGSAFEMNDVFARAILRLESSLGATGPLYDDILRALIASGNTFGFFIDSEAELGPSGLSEEQLAKRAKDRADASSLAIFGVKGAFNQDANGRILPSNIASLFASGRQIDDLGRDSFATIRIFTSTDEDGRVVGYTVQIPSTQSAFPWRSGAPNDLTADLHAMIAGRQTALSHAVIEAMEATGIPKGPDSPPILITGFSLGGITAASIASSDTGYNVRHVITAGSPIGQFPIPASVDVLAFESRQDVVCASDGSPNPTSWTTISRNAPLLTGESSQKLVVLNEAHDLDRYARMAASEFNAGNDSRFARYFNG
ncbi:MAG TPA: hypothetical protein VIG47_17530, partial [Gemmatimonadaceae bacterium]